MKSNECLLHLFCYMKDLMTEYSDLLAMTVMKREIKLPNAESYSFINSI